MQDYWFTGKEKEEPNPYPELEGTPWSRISYDEKTVSMNTEYGVGFTSIAYDQIDAVIVLLKNAKAKRDQILRDRIRKYEDILNDSGRIQGNS